MLGSEKWKTLQNLNEASFRVEVIIPILKKLGMEDVRERHGTDEYGKDITCYQHSPLFDTYYAVVAKVGKIDGSAGGKQNLSVIRTQIQMAFDMPIEDVQRQRKHPVNRVFVWTTGKISGNAQRQIMQSADYRNVAFFDGQKTIDLLEEYFPSFFTIRDPYISEYYSAAKENFARIQELHTLGVSGDHHKLPTIFVPPTLNLLEGQRVRNRRGEAGIDVTKNYRYEDLVNASDDALIVGEAGTGKSTILRKVLLDTIEYNEQAALRSPIPVFIEFKNIDTSQDNCITNAVIKEFTRFATGNENQELSLNFEDGSVVILADGLDELKSEEKVQEAIELVKQFKITFKRTRFILSSRFSESVRKINAFPGFKVLEVQELNPPQMVKFIQNWYGKNSKIAAKLIQFVQESSSFQGLPATPLTLAIVATLHENGTKELPTNLTELFQKYIELALGRWDQSRNIAIQFEWRIKEFILRKIGWKMHETLVLSLPCSTVEATIAEISNDRGLAINVVDFCDEIVARSELIIRNNDDEYEFKHRSFKDFFAGLEFSVRADSLKTAAEKILDPWWSQVIFFASGLQPSDPSYIDFILRKTRITGIDHLFAAIYVGPLIQGTYLAPKDIKIKTIQFVLENLIEAWDNLCFHIKDLKINSSSKEFQLDHQKLIFVFGALAQVTLGSITLAPIIDALLDEYISNSTEGLPKRAVATRQYHMYFLAMASSRCGNIGAFIKVFESNIITDPSLLLAGYSESKAISERSWVEEQDRKQSLKLVERLGRRLSRLKEYRANLIGKDPVPLPQLDNKEIIIPSDSQPLLTDNSE